MPQKETARSFHLCVPVEKGIELLKKGKNIWDASPATVLRELTERRAKGIKYMAGCDKENAEGRCGGHEIN